MENVKKARVGGRWWQGRGENWTGGGNWRGEWVIQGGGEGGSSSTRVGGRGLDIFSFFFILLKSVVISFYLTKRLIMETHSKGGIIRR